MPSEAFLDSSPDCVGLRMTEAFKMKPQLVQIGWGFLRFWWWDEKGNPAASFQELFVCQYILFTLIKCVG